VSRNARVGLIAVALVLAFSAFILRATGVDSTDRWWEIALPGIVAATMVFLLIGEVRSDRERDR
jgi:4-amino-4-deoxy-L-arabinose transferase-like glycosyltransferase